MSSHTGGGAMLCTKKKTSEGSRSSAHGTLCAPSISLTFFGPRKLRPTSEAAKPLSRPHPEAGGTGKAPAGYQTRHPWSTLCAWPQRASNFTRIRTESDHHPGSQKGPVLLSTQPRVCCPFTFRVLLGRTSMPCNKLSCFYAFFTP